MNIDTQLDETLLYNTRRNKTRFSFTSRNKTSQNSQTALQGFIALWGCFALQLEKNPLEIASTSPLYTMPLWSAPLVYIQTARHLTQPDARDDMPNHTPKIIVLWEGQVQDLKSQLANATAENSKLINLADQLQKQNEVLMLPSSTEKTNRLQRLLGISTS